MKKTIFGIILVGLLLTGIALSGLVIDMNKTEYGWVHIASLKASDTGDGTDHIENIYIYPLSEKADITSSPYECNEGDAFEHGDDVNGFDDGEELTGETPYSTSYIIAIEVNFSDKAYNSTSADWETGLVKAEITSSDLSLSAVVMEEAPDLSQQSGTTSAHLTFYYDFSDSGDTLSVGEIA